MRSSWGGLPVALLGQVAAAAGRRQPSMPLRCYPRTPRAPPPPGPRAPPRSLPSGAELPPERFSSFKASLADKYLEPPRSLAEAAARAWQPIRYRTYAFGRRQAKAQRLQATTHQVRLLLCHPPSLFFGGGGRGERRQASALALAIQFGMLQCAGVWGAGRGGADGCKAELGGAGKAHGAA